MRSKNIAPTQAPSRHATLFMSSSANKLDLWGQHVARLADPLDKADLLFKTVDDFAEGEPQADDITCVATALVCREPKERYKATALFTESICCPNWRTTDINSSGDS